VPLRLHVKTAKAPEVAELVFGEANTGAIAVSTLAEAEAFADAGYNRLFYAVGITAAKLRVFCAAARGVMLTVLWYSAEQARAVAEAHARPVSRSPLSSRSTATVTAAGCLLTTQRWSSWQCSCGRRRRAARRAHPRRRVLPREVTAGAA
jgi:hypothetical protein